MLDAAVPAGCAAGSPGPRSQQQQQAAAASLPAPGDVLLYCRKGSGIGGLPALERLLVLRVDLLSRSSPSQKVT